MVADKTGALAVDWSSWVRAHNPRVVASLLALSVPIDQAEELASQAWARLIEQHQAGALVEIKLPGLAIKQARFLALSWLEGRRRESGLTNRDRDTDTAEAMAEDSADPERLLIARRDVEMALRVIAGSSRSAQAVFHHLYDDPPPTHEVVAERVGLSVQRVRQILCEVRKKIRAALESKS